MDAAPVRPAVRLGVVVGGAAGTLLRAGVSAALPAGSGVPWGTLAANLTGALLLGLLVGSAARRRTDDVLVATIGTGLLGAYTTFSALAVETVELLADDPAAGAGYAVLSLVGGIVLALTGRRLGARGGTS